MNELLVDLFKYRSREKREAMEDWLTECVAAILRALPSQQFATVVERLTGQDCRGTLANGSRLSIATQVVIGTDETTSEETAQRPDLIVSLGGHPWLLFENKVAHHVDPRCDREMKSLSQLERYGEWLSKADFDPPGVSKALVFVTHFTLPPSSFVATSSNKPCYEGLSRIVSTWGALARLFDDATVGLEETNHVRALVDAYSTFLKENSMSDEYPGSQDIALLGLHLGASDRLDKLVDDMFARVDGMGEWNGNACWAHADVEYGRFNAYRYVHLPRGWPNDAYLAAGLWYPDAPNQLYRGEMDNERSKKGEPPVSSAPKVFLQLAHEHDGMFKHDGLPGQDWSRPVSDFFVHRDFDSFHGDPAARAVAILAWMDEKVSELREFVRANGQ